MNGRVAVGLLALALAVGVPLASASTGVAAVTPGERLDGSVTDPSSVNESSVTEPPSVTCPDADGNRLVVYYQTGERFTGGSLYPGTRLTIYLCAGGEPEPFGSAWELAANATYQQVDSGSEWVTIEVNATGAGLSVSLANQIDKRKVESGPTLGVPETRRTTWTSEDGRQVHVRFGSADALSTFQQRAQRLAAAHDALADALSGLPANATDDPNSSSSNMTAIVRALEAIDRQTTRLQRAAFAATAVGNTTAAATIADRSAADARRANQRARERLAQYDDSLTDAQRNAANTARLLLGGTLLGGGVVGLIAGAYWSREIRGDVIERQGWSSDVKLTLKRFRRPLAVGAVLVIVGLVVAAVFGGVALLEVIV